MKKRTVNPELVVVVADSTGPNPVGRPIHPVPVQLWADLGEIADRMADDAPIDHVRRLKDNHPRGELHGGGDGVIIGPHLDAIQVTEVGGEHGIEISPVRLGAPFGPVPPGLFLGEGAVGLANPEKEAAGQELVFHAGKRFQGW